MKHMNRGGFAAAALIALLGATAAVAIARESAPSVGDNTDVKIVENASQLPFAPSADSPASPSATTFAYQGREISAGEAASQGLSCVQQNGGQGQCFGTGRELDRYENVPSMAARLRSAERGTRVLPATSKKQTRSGRQYAQASSHTSCCPLML